MASACALEWVPDSLYNTAVSAVVASYSRHRRELKTLPEDVQFDIYYTLGAVSVQNIDAQHKDIVVASVSCARVWNILSSFSILYNKGRLCQLGMEFSELEVFARVLRVNNKRTLLHHCFQALMDHGVRISEILAEAFSNQLTPQHFSDQANRVRALNLGLALGGFLSEAGWFSDSEKVYQVCLDAMHSDHSEAGLWRAMEYCVRLLHVQNANCKYLAAKQTCAEAFAIVEHLAQKGITFNRAILYSEQCALLFAQSLYDEAFKACSLALRELNGSVNKRDTGEIRFSCNPAKAGSRVQRVNKWTVIDVLRQCAKACVVKREFKKAEVLIKLAVHQAREHFGPHHPKYSDALLDYGFFLLNVDSITSAVQVYQMALDIRQSVFGGNNLFVAIACEDLAYASYVYEYSSGKFNDAREHAEKAIQVLNHILPSDHLLLSSSKRVKALILEEIAIDSHDKEMEEKLLREAQELHLQSLELARKAFGENNVQTAKHYGNLGRLYQSMHRFKEAEEMHLKAIEIKERLLGPDDYEVALSVGHLASLYNYDMSKFEEAEKLYLRSINIGKALFGEAYSGLEYDYRGLLRLYHSTGNNNLALHFSNILQQWNQLRDQSNATEAKPLDFDVYDSLENIIQKHFLS